MGIAVPEAAWQACGHLQRTLLRHDCACRSCWLWQDHGAEGAGGLPGVRAVHLGGTRARPVAGAPAPGVLPPHMSAMAGGSVLM